MPLVALSPWQDHRKLHEKSQTSLQQKQASHAINLYYSIKNGDLTHNMINQAPILSKDVAQKSSVAPTPEKTA